MAFQLGSIKQMQIRITAILHIIDRRLAHNYKLFVLQAAISLGIHNLKMSKNYLTCLILDKIKSAFHQTSMNIFQSDFL